MTRTSQAKTLLRLLAVASLLAGFAATAPTTLALTGPAWDVDTYDQCANDDGDGFASTRKSGCDWIQGALGSANSTWNENDSVPERLALKGLIVGGTYDVTFSYGTTKQGKHAYDFLTNYNASESWITTADRCEGLWAGCTTATDVLAPIPADPMARGLDVTFGSRNFTVRGASSATVVAGPTLVSLDYSGDSETEITLRFVASGANAAIWFGAHVADATAWGEPGAGSIPGSPFHVAVIDINTNAVGQRDNQMSADFASPPPAGTGNLQLNVILDGGPVGYTGPFTINYSCLAPSATTGSFSISSGSSAQLTGLSEGTSCTVTQTLPAPPSGWTFGAPVWDPDPATVTIVSATVSRVTVTNTLTALAGTLNITIADVAGFTGVFQVSYLCSPGGGATVGVTDGTTRIVTGLTTPTTCSITSITPPAAPAGYTWSGPTYTASSASIPAGGSGTVAASYTLTPPAPPAPVTPAAPVPALTVTKEASLSKSGPWERSLETEAGTPVWYRIVVSNTGAVALTGLSVTDTLTDDATPPGCPAIPASLAIGAKWTCTYSIEALEGTTINTVTVDSDQTAPATASADVFGAEGEALPATDVTTLLAPGVVERYAPLGLGLLFAALLIALALGLPGRKDERKR